jgi:tricorn protease
MAGLLLAWAAVLGLALGGTARAAELEGFYRFPAIHGDTLVFVAEGDLWRVGVQGGRAERLTTFAELELRPALSPDGLWLAFNASYEGAYEAYLMPLAGGTPRRLSWDGLGHRVMGFAPDGRLLLLVATASGRPGWQLARVDPQTLAREVLPAAPLTDGAIAADGRTLVFTRGGLEVMRGDNVAAYRGGNMARLWTLDLQDGPVRPRRPLQPVVQRRPGPRPAAAHAAPRAGRAPRGAPRLARRLCDRRRPAAAGPGHRRGPQGACPAVG